MLQEEIWRAGTDHFHSRTSFCISPDSPHFKTIPLQCYTHYYDPSMTVKYRGSDTMFSLPILIPDTSWLTFYFVIVSSVVILIQTTKKLMFNPVCISCFNDAFIKCFEWVFQEVKHIYFILLWKYLTWILLKFLAKNNILQDSFWKCHDSIII